MSQTRSVMDCMLDSLMQYVVQLEDTSRRGPGMLEHKSTGDPDPNGATHQVTVHASLKKQGSIRKVRGIPE